MCFVVSFELILVEDDPLLSLVLADVLTARGCTVHTAEDAKGGLDLLRRCPGVEVLVTDIDLGPGPDGVVLGERALRVRHPRLRGVVYASGHAERLSMHILGGREILLAKPYRTDELLAAIGRLPPR